nr:serine/arginine repetitive matrix protein 1-like [Salvelinus alpinus]
MTTSEPTRKPPPPKTWRTRIAQILHQPAPPNDTDWRAASKSSRARASLPAARAPQTHHPAARAYAPENDGCRARPGSVLTRNTTPTTPTTAKRRPDISPQEREPGKSERGQPHQDTSRRRAKNARTNEQREPFGGHLPTGTCPDHHKNSRPTQDTKSPHSEQRGRMQNTQYTPAGRKPKPPARQAETHAGARTPKKALRRDAKPGKQDTPPTGPTTARTEVTRPTRKPGDETVQQASAMTASPVRDRRQTGATAPPPPRVQTRPSRPHRRLPKPGEQRGGKARENPHQTQHGAQDPLGGPNCATQTRAPLYQPATRLQGSWTSPQPLNAPATSAPSRKEHDPNPRYNPEISQPDASNAAKNATTRRRTESTRRTII